MNEDYLWDRSGPPDPEIQKLEDSLASLRFRPSQQMAKPVRPSRLRWAAAAAVLLAAIGLSRFATPSGAVTPWQVSRMSGAVQIGSHDAAPTMSLRTGDVLRTGTASELSLESDPVGQLDLGPNSELRATTDRKLLLDRGRLHAFIWARPREFVVDTPSARAVDLGCEYTINVDDSGNGLIRVAMGWVAFQFQGHESFIPAHAACVTRQKQGPGIPYYEDSSDQFRQSLNAFEQGDSAALSAILASARSNDGLTLWHLLTRVPDTSVGAVYDRFAQLVALPPEVTRQAILRRDSKAIDRCWDALNLENTDWWRGWERRWQ